MRRAPGADSAALSRREITLALFLFTALTLLLAYPVSLHPATLRFDTGPDGDLGWYLLAWNTHAFLHRPWAIFDANIYYPFPLTLAYGENVIGLAFFAAPVIWLTGNVPLAANFVSLSSCVLCGFGAYVLARRLGLSALAAVICGIIFECAPPRFFRIGQITLTSVQWIPLALASAHAYFEHGRKRDLRLVAACVSMQVLSTGHGAVFIALTLLCFGLYRFVLGEPWQLGKRVRDLGVTGVVLLLPALLVYVPYPQVQRLAGLRRGLGTWYPNYELFLASPSHLHRFLFSLVGATGMLDAEPYLFPGYLAVVLAVCALAWRRRGAEAPAQASPSLWRRTVFALELVLLASAAAATVLTAGALMNLRIGGVWVAELGGAARAWIVFGCAALGGVALRRHLPSDARERLGRPLAILVAAALVGAAVGVGRGRLQAGDGLVGEYFTNPDWQGRPAFSIADTEFSTDRMMRLWPGSAPEQFSVRWFGFLTVARSGLYTFSTTSDDGSQLFVDNNTSPVVDNGGLHGAATQSGSIQLDRGSHMVELRYTQLGGNKALNWSWAREGAAPVTVPAWVLSQRRASYGAVMAARALDWIRIVLACVAALAAAWASWVWWRGPAGITIAGWAAARRRDSTAFYAVFTLLMLALAVGPPHGLWQYVYWMPVFSFIRVSSRFILVALLGLAVLAAIGFDKITFRWAPRARAILAAAISVVLVAEYAGMPIGYTQVNLEIPAIDRWLDSQPKPFSIAEVPARTDRDQVDFMMHSTAHWQKTIQGYHGWRSEFHHELNFDMLGFPDETSLRRLGEVGVTYVVVHSERYPPDEWRRVEESLRHFSSRLHLEHVEGNGRVYSVTKSDAALR
jgi:hypothetical protein